MGRLRTRVVLLPLAATLAFAGGCGDRAETAATETTPPPMASSRDARNADLASSFSLPTGFTLAEETQRYIWDVEHLAFILGQDVVSPFKSLVREGDRTFAAFLADDFRGGFFVGRGERSGGESLAIERWGEGSELGWLGRDEFVEALILLGRSFEVLDKVDVHVYHLTPDERGRFERPWRSRWDVRVAGLLPGGRRAENRFNVEFAFDRLSKEMAQETEWITEFRVLDAKFAASPASLLEEITDETGIDLERLYDNWNQAKPPWNPVPGVARSLDYDRDGRVDLLLTEMYNVPHLFLYRGNGDGTFDNVTNDVGLSDIARLGFKTWLTGALVADLDDDGFEDLVFSVEQEAAPGQVAHAVAVLRNVEGRTFETIPETVHQLGGRFRLAPRGMAVADYDNDGLVDLYLGPVGEDPPAEHRQARWIGDQSSREGVLLRNLGEFRFADATAAAGVDGDFIDTSSATWLDLEPDGDADLFLGNHMGPNVLWENQGDGTFVRLPQPPGFGGFSMGAAAGDLDGDGDPDLYVANMYTSAGGRIIDNLRPEDYPPGAYELIRGFATGNELYENHGDGTISALGTAADVDNGGWAYGPELIDLDGDGHLDLYSPAGYQSVKRGEPDG